MSSSPGGAVPVTRLDPISCSDALDLIRSCKNNPQSRILFIDIRSRQLYGASHLCLDSRLQKTSVRDQVDVINIAKFAGTVTIPKIKKSLEDLKNDKNIFEDRSKYKHVIVIDDGSDEADFVGRLKRALTNFDCDTNKKITADLKSLEGGFSEWSLTYPHYTTSPPPFESDEQRQPTVLNTNGVSNETNRPSIDSKEKTTHPIRFISNEITVDRLPQISPTVPALPKPAPVVPPKPSQHETQVNPQPSPQPPPQALAHSIILCQPKDPSNDQNNNVQGKTGLFSRSINNNTVEIPKFDRTQKPHQLIHERQGDTLNNHRESFNATSQPLNFKPSVPDCAQPDRFPTTGLANLGNTCYINSVIQCLAYNPSIKDYFIRRDPSFIKDIDGQSGEGDKKSGTNGQLAYQFGFLIKELNANSYKYVTPASFYHTIARHMNFADGKQHDSHEFMIDLFDKLHHDLNRSATVSNQLQSQSSDLSNGTTNNVMAWKKFWKEHKERNNSKICEEFQGIYMHTLSRGCGHKSTSFESFFAVSLPILDYAPECSLEECLNLFFKKEQLELKCDDCSRTTLTDKKIDISYQPKTLIIHLKRFEQEGQKSIKKDTLVRFPLNLEIPLESSLLQPPYRPIRGKYSLQAVVNHNGTLYTGHYFAFSKIVHHYFNCKQQQKWYRFSDTEAREITDNDLCTNEAFILFYSLDNWEQVLQCYRN